MEILSGVIIVVVQIEMLCEAREDIFANTRNIAHVFQEIEL